MRAALSSIVLWAASRSAAALSIGTDLAAREASLGTWYLVGFEPTCNDFYCYADYAVYAAENAVEGFPAFAARCGTYTSCSNIMDGRSTVSSDSYTNSGQLTIRQTATVNGKTKTATAIVPWNEMTLAYFVVNVTSVSG
ncbi:hypothetical protein F5Y19DRAFT_431545 [Xylariaceae sp. FL1651]|nr:hypothetical protein F5Y19DRAFT_431545 [Xylariaceae sp. FL1651]